MRLKYQKYQLIKFISVMDWLGNSPDLNPMENLWSITKLHLQRRDCTTVIKLIETIFECEYLDPQIQDTCKKLADLTTDAMRRSPITREPRIATFYRKIFLLKTQVNLLLFNVTLHL